MCTVTRRGFLQGTAALLGVAGSVPVSPPEIGKVEMVSKDVYFHEGDLPAKGHCNNGWVIFEDYVLVIDANFPSGAQDVLPKIRALTAKPIRFAFDTHHHGDHAYGNQVWVENGAAPVAHTGVIEEMKRYETGYYGNTPGRWEESAKTRADVKASRLKPPSVLFPRELIFDDGTHRVELLHLGVAHTHGDAFAWLPKERILFTGDACVNGPFNYVGDGNIEQWVKTLDAARKLGTRTVCPGHGPRGSETVLEDQQGFFQALRIRVGALVSAKKTPEEVRGSVDQIRAQLTSDPKIARYVGQEGFAAQVEKVYTELTGQAFPAARRSVQEARARHARDHGLSLLESHRA